MSLARELIYSFPSIILPISPIASQRPVLRVSLVASSLPQYRSIEYADLTCISPSSPSLRGLSVESRISISYPKHGLPAESGLSLNSCPPIDVMTPHDSLLPYP